MTPSEKKAIAHRRRAQKDRDTSEEKRECAGKSRCCDIDDSRAEAIACCRPRSRHVVLLSAAATAVVLVRFEAERCLARRIDGETFSDGLRHSPRHLERIYKIRYTSGVLLEGFRDIAASVLLYEGSCSGDRFS